MPWAHTSSIQVKVLWRQRREKGGKGRTGNIGSKKRIGGGVWDYMIGLKRSAIVINGDWGLAEELRKVSPRRWMRVGMCCSVNGRRIVEEKED